MVILNSFEGAVVVMTIKKTNLKYFLLPLISALFIVTLITLVLFTFFNGNKALVDTKLANNIEDFNSLKLVNSIATPMDDSGSYWYAPSESFKVDDGYIFTKRRSETETIVVDETTGTTEDIVHMFTIIMKTDFEGNEIWSYEFESTDTGWHHDILVYNDIVYVAGNYYGMFTLNANNGSLLNSYPDYFCYKLSIEEQYIAGISDTNYYLFDLNLNIIKMIDANNIEGDTYDVWFYDYYFDGSNYYILGEQDVENVYTPYVFTFDSNFNLVNELQVTYDENQGVLSTSGYYDQYFNFIKYNDKFYQIGEDVHEIDATTGVNARLLDSTYNRFNSEYSHYYEKTTDVLIVGDKILSIDTIFGSDTVGKTYISINDSSFGIRDSIQVNDGYSTYSAYGEQISLIDNGVLVKWYDFDANMIYLSEFEFTYEPVCTVVEGNGTEFGDKIQCGSESFYVTGYDGENVTMLSEYNLLAGTDYNVVYFDEPIVTNNYDDYYGVEDVWDMVEQGYYIYNSLRSYSDGTYTLYGVSFTRDASPGFEYVGLKFDSSVPMTEFDFFRIDAVKEKMLDGYGIGEIYSENFQCDSSTTICTNNYYGMVLYKQDNYVAHTIYFDDLVSKDDIDTFLSTHSEYQEYYNNGYRIDSYMEETRYDGSSYSYYYTGVVLYKFTGDLNDPNYYGPFIQDETAIGAHGTAEGKPDPNEIGILFANYGLYWGGVDAVDLGTGFYETGFVDFDLLYDGEVLYYLSYYNNYLSRMGVKTSSVTIPTVTDINNWAYDVTGNNIPLEDWYLNAVSEYNQNHNVSFMVLGPVKDYFVNHPWLYQTTYYLRTASPEYTTYFIDTLGYLCSADTCNVSIGAGVRPLVTMSIDNIAFDIFTEDDGNGTVVASKSTAKKGDIITFEITPNDGYVLKDVIITDSLGNEIIYTDNKFVMPAADVTISATFEKIILIEPTISIVPNRDRNNPLDENVSFYVTITNPYDIPLTDVKVTSDSDFSSCFINCSVLENNIVEIPVLEAGSSISYSIFYYVTEVGTIKGNVEILSANAESPYFFNHEEPYVANTEASTIALVQVCNVLDGDGNGGVNQYNLISYDLYGTALLDYWFTLKDNTCVTLALETDITYNLYQLDRQEYKLISVEGLITSNEGSFILEPKEYNIIFNNLYEKKNYFHSWNRVENDVIMNLDPS